MLAWLSVWSVQTCIWPSWCHCHSLSLASVKSRLVLPFWYQLTRVVPYKGTLNGCVCNNRPNYDNVRGAIIMAKVIARVHHVHLMNADMSAVWPPTLTPRASRLGLWVHRKLAVTVHSIAVRNTPHATRTHMPYGITQCYLPPGRADIPALTSVEASTRFSDSGGIQG